MEGGWTHYQTRLCREQIRGSQSWIPLGKSADFGPELQIISVEAQSEISRHV